MNEWLRAIAAGSQLSDEAASRLRDDGFCVVPGPVIAEELDRLSGAYDRAMAAADPADRCEGSTTTRLHDFVNRGAEFDPLYVHPSLLEVCCQTLGPSFKLSSVLGRTLLPGKSAQELHVDYPSDGLGWTMIGFIFMIDEFRRDNGATRFLPKSRRQATIRAVDDELVPACGMAMARTRVGTRGAPCRGPSFAATRNRQPISPPA